MDENYYDLLASEARIASIVAIGKDVPSSHWLHMARPLTKHAGSDFYFHGARPCLNISCHCCI